MCGVAEGTPSSVAHCTLRHTYIPQGKLVCSVVCIEPVCSASPLLVYYQVVDNQ